MRGNANGRTRTTLGFATVVAAAIALMPLLVETGPQSPGDAPVAGATRPR